MSLTLESVSALSPDPASTKAGQKLAAVKNWKGLGRTEAAIWGQCQGSALYQVRVELTGYKNKCSCPSRKFPCKHVLGLLMILAGQPAAVPTDAIPDWVEEWLAKQTEAAEKKAVKAEAQAAKPVDEKARAKRIEKRESLIADGLDRLNTWLADVVRTGLGSWERQAHDQASEMSRRLVDAQAAGLASAVAELGSLPAFGGDWPTRFLRDAGRLRLLTHAYARQDALPTDLQADLRQAIGWTIDAAEVDHTGEAVTDRWAVIGQWIDSNDRIETQRSWLVGVTTGRTALVLQFRPNRAYGGGAMPGFPEPILPGTVGSATVRYYPGRSQQRARVCERDETTEALTERVPGVSQCAELLTNWADDLGRWPILIGSGVVLHDVTILPPTDPKSEQGDWAVRDHVGETLPLQNRDVWKLLAITGGQPCDLFGEWNGRKLLVLGAFVEGGFVTP